MGIMTKRILVNLPGKLYEDLKHLAKSEYKSISGIIRESILDRVQDTLSKSEAGLIEKGRADYRQGKGVPWRSARRG